MTDTSRDIAIVGMAGLYPRADDIDIFWANILNKVDAVTDASDDWLGDPFILDPESTSVHQIYTSRGGFLGDLSRFDARSFATMPLSVEGSQPDQLLGLKIAFDALSDAGYPAGAFDGSKTGVILGHAIHANRANTNGIQQVWFHTQLRTLLRSLFPDITAERVESVISSFEDKLPTISTDAVPGLVPNILTGRIANRLDLMGPNYIIDAACASSLISVNLAIGELRAGRADMMLAGGINTTTSPLVYAVFCSVGALSRSGRIRPFDAVADGTILGEGAGIVVLKRLDDAIAHGDRIYAVIKGAGESSDGKSSGLMAPRLEGEVLAMRNAYQETGIDPATIGLVEAHGTGIPLGDRTEVDALREIFGPRDGPAPAVPIGSVKSMIGHCIPASGSAAIIKMALALHEKLIPPTLCDDVNAEIGLETTPFYVSTEARPWVHGGPAPRRAAINAFGFGGINSHMILEESPLGQTIDATAAFGLRDVGTGERDQVFVFAGPARAGLVAAVEGFASTLAGDQTVSFAEAAERSWLDARAAGGPERLAVVAADPGQLEKRLDGALARLADPATSSLQTRNGVYFEAAPVDGKIAFLFPGEMAQYSGMMRDAAIASPIVRDWFDFIDRLFQDDRDVLHHHVADPPPTLVDAECRARLDRLLHQVDYGSEIVFAADQAVFALMSALNIRGDAMLGHSTGENAAIIASGRLAMSRDDVGRMIVQMNRVFDRVETSGAVPQGVLLTIAALERGAVDELLAGRPDIHLTMDNCPNQTIVFGAAEDIDGLEEAATALGAVCTRLPISWGYHTAYVGPMAEAFDELFANVTVQPSDVTLYSCAAAAPFPTDAQAFRAMAVEQYVSPVRFTEAIGRLYADGCRIFIECGPNAVLTAFVRDILGDRPHVAESADSRRRGMLTQLRHLVARLFAAGLDVDADWLLFPDESADAGRRRTVREAQRQAPFLPSVLPFTHIDTGEAAALRALVGLDGESRAGHRAAEAATASRPSPQPASASPVAGHFALMRDFLGQQERIGRQAVAAPHVARPATAARPAPSPATPQDGRIAVVDLARLFEVPFDLRAYLMRGALAPAALAPFLGAEERDEAAEIMARYRGGHRWAEWGLSRLAVKRAAAELVFARLGTRPGDDQIAVRKRASGAPYIALPEPGGPAPAISIAHALSAGVGAAGAPDWRIGIDLDAPSRIRDPAEFLDTVLGEDERRLLPIGADAATAATVWCLKEAAAKAVGTGIGGEPRSFALAAFDPAAGTATVVHDTATLAVASRTVGQGVVALAYAPRPA